MSREAAVFLKTLKQEGIEEIYVGSRRAVAPGKQVKVSTVKKGGSAKDQILALREQVLKCTLCKELSSTRTNVVFGAGNIKADLMFVGEAPGRDEDLQGLPFVGRAGKLLTKIIEAMGLTRKQIFIANTLKCRPPQNRPPKPGEIENCNAFLKAQIELIKPKVICALGTFAGQTVLKTDTPISKLRGKFYDLPPFPDGKDLGVQVMCTYHPAYLLRNPAEKKKVWADMKKIMKHLGI